MNLSWINIFLVTRMLSIFALTACLALLAAPSSADRLGENNLQYNQYVKFSFLPPEAKETLRLIKQGGPYPYPRDGVVFGNYEKRLPKKQRGYYHEYTVKTPGVHHRGARRIVCGPPLECYYTDDHYETFKLIRE